MSEVPVDLVRAVSGEEVEAAAERLPAWLAPQLARARMLSGASAGILAETLDSSDVRVRLAALGSAPLELLSAQVVERCLGDPEWLVAEQAIFLAGELELRSLVPRLVELARTGDEIWVREAAIAALGAIGDPAAVPVIAAAIRSEKVYVRRRAVVAAAAFDGEELENALAEARNDRDPQVRALVEEIEGSVTDKRWE